MTTPADALALLRSRDYLRLLILAAILGLPVSAIAFGFLALVSKLQCWLYTDPAQGPGLPRRADLVAAAPGAAGGIALSHLPGLG